jgi:F0F1-type ATP synthase membrane subunit a
MYVQVAFNGAFQIFTVVAWFFLHLFYSLVQGGLLVTLESVYEED